MGKVFEGQDDRSVVDVYLNLEVDPNPLYALSPWLYMQFMEPLGTTDSSVAAAWDHLENRWKGDVVETTRTLAPPLLRWGGCFSSYYRWKEGVGPRDQRQPMLNLLWGGVETNQVGTVEFVDFCGQVGADPLMNVNFESDGREHWMMDPRGSVRSAGPDEAAEWVAYCNDPDNRLRLSHGLKEPCRIPIWQIGNETSYDKRGFDCETAARKTVEFAEAMRKADASIMLIGWGDGGWAKRMIEVAGGHLDFLAFHHMYNPGAEEDSPLRGTVYREDPARTWDALMNAWKPHDAKIKEIRQETDGSGIPLAMTECHFSLKGPNRCHLLSTWASGVAMARLLNVHTRHGDVLKIATAADFCGNVWQVNALMIPDRQPPYLMPVARVMQLYRAHVGEHAVKLLQAPSGLDVTCSRTGNTLFLHVVNTHRTRPIDARFAVKGMAVTSGRIFEISADPTFELWSETRDVIAPKEHDLPQSGGWQFPPASVSAVELRVSAV
jgi:alpha-L-arabinofuranosidase